MTRDARVTLRGTVHLGWLVGVAAVVAWVGPGFDFPLALLCVLTAYSVWRTAEQEEPEC